MSGRCSRQGQPREPSAADDRFVPAGRVPRPAIRRQTVQQLRPSERTPGSESWFANADRGFMLFDGVLKEETPFYKTGPMQGRPADGRFAPGTRVGIAPTHRPIGGYVGPTPRRLTAGRGPARTARDTSRNRRSRWTRRATSWPKWTVQVVWSASGRLTRRTPATSESISMGPRSRSSRPPWKSCSAASGRRRLTAKR